MIIGIIHNSWVKYCCVEVCAISGTVNTIDLPLTYKVPKKYS